MKKCRETTDCCSPGVCPRRGILRSRLDGQTEAGRMEPSEPCNKRTIFGDLPSVKLAAP